MSEYRHTRAYLDPFAHELLALAAQAEHPRRARRLTR
jgi:hypothetical protein